MTPEELERNLANGKIQLDYWLDTEPVDSADVVMFRRYYGTAYKCALGCDFRTHDQVAARAHPHGIKMLPGTGIPERDTVTAAIWNSVEKMPDKAIFYDTDDLLIRGGVKKWNGLWPDIEASEVLSRRMAQRADAMSVSTPMLARHYSVVNSRIRVIRNAVNPDLYVSDQPRPEGNLPRLLFYGNGAKLRDYAGYPDVRTQKMVGGYPKAAVDEIKYKLHSVFLGSEDRNASVLRRYFTELHC